MSSLTNRATLRALRFAHISRLLSWIAAAVGLGFAILFLLQAGFFEALVPDQPVPPPIPNPDRITATDSTINGMDRENQPYEVKAKRGWQDETTPTMVHLEEIEGNFRRASGNEYTISAGTGIYDTKLKALDLADQVTIVQKGHFTAHMAKAHVVVEEKRLTSDSPVDVDFASGTIKSHGIEITDDGARILFLNGVKAVFGAATATGDSQK